MMAKDLPQKNRLIYSIIGIGFFWDATKMILIAQKIT